MTPLRRLAVVGGAGGIGRELVAAAKASGRSVAVLDLPASLDRHPFPDLPALPIDVTDETSVTTAFARLGESFPALDELVYLPGFAPRRQPVLDLPSRTFEEILAVNLVGAQRVMQAAVGLLAEGVEPSLVTVASGLAQFVRPGYGAYAAAKAGLVALTKTLALELAPKIRCNAVAPGAVDTAFLRGGTGRSGEDQPVTLDLDAYARAVPLGRAAVPEDVAGPILFLLGPDSRYMTGQVLWVNGGAYMP